MAGVYGDHHIAKQDGLGDVSRRRGRRRGGADVDHQPVAVARVRRQLETPGRGVFLQLQHHPQEALVLAGPDLFQEPVLGDGLGQAAG